jgi:FkbM family methyltransferase
MSLKIKLILAKFLCSNFLGNLIAYFFHNSIPSLVFRGLKFDCSSNQISSSVKAQIFFGIYESAEYRFCKKYVPFNANVIELGSSIGLISSFLSQNKSPKTIIAVEANPELKSVIASNFKLNGATNYKIINKAIGLDKSENLWFSRGCDNTTGVISDKQSFGAIKVECTTLSDLIEEENFGNYILICDIEGGEVDILQDTGSGLDRCDLMIIEIHRVEREGRKYSIDDIVDEILAKGFKNLDRYGNTFVFSK